MGPSSAFWGEGLWGGAVLLGAAALSALHLSPPIALGFSPRGTSAAEAEIAGLEGLLHSKNVTPTLSQRNRSSQGPGKFIARHHTMARAIWR